MRLPVASILATLSLSKLVTALGSSCSAPLTPSAAASDPFWLEDIKHQGTSAFNADPSSYSVFRNVKDYGAKGDGSTDDTAAINSAITAGSRCGSGCASSTLTPALVYFPPGTYVVSTPIIPLYYTSLVGDKKNPPTLKATSSFSGIAVIDADPYLAGGANLYTNQNNFFRAVRNFVIDVTAICDTCGGTGLHWQVAQATSLVNVVVNMSKNSGNTHQGIFMENGSGGVMTDLVFNGGKFGVWLGNQQFTVRNITVNDAAIAIHNQWNWGWAYQGVTINNCGVGFEVATDGPSQSPPGQTVGSDSIIDAVVTNTPVFLTTTSNQPSSLSGSILLENIVASNVPVIVSDPAGTVLAGSSGAITIDQWIQGNVYSGSTSAPRYVQGKLTKPSKPSSLTSGGKVFGRSRPQYEAYAVSQFISVKSEGAKGDGKTDDTAALQAVFDKYSGCRIIFIDAGTYVVTSTLKIPAGSQVVGELWSNIVASGSAFSDASNPTVVVQVGEAGDTGRTEISDIVFTTLSGSAGAIVVEWNVADAPGEQGSAAMWDTHVRLGGYQGSGIQESNCAKLSGHTVAPCTAAYLSLHLTKSSSAYLENVWLWTADHDLDAADQGQIDVYAGRGMLIESQGPVWLLGTAAEHHAIYQYNIANAAAVYIALIQTETPYYQPSPATPSPFTLSTSLHDPTFPSGQQSAWALNIVGSSEVHAYGVNLYSFFQNYDQTCGNTFSCQNAIFSVDSASTNIYIYNLNTVWTTFQVWYNGAGTINQSSNSNGFASTVGLWTSEAGALPSATKPSATKSKRSEPIAYGPGVHVHPPPKEPAAHVPRGHGEPTIPRALHEMHSAKRNVPRGHGEPSIQAPRALKEMHGAKLNIARDHVLDFIARSPGEPLHAAPQARAQHRGDLEASIEVARTMNVPRGHGEPTLPVIARALKEMHGAKRDNAPELTARGAAPQARAQHRGDVNRPSVARSMNVPRGHGEPTLPVPRALKEMHDSHAKRDSAPELSIRGAAPQARAQHRGEVDAPIVARSTNVPRGHGEPTIRDVASTLLQTRSEALKTPRGHAEPASVRTTRSAAAQRYVPPGHGQSSVVTVARVPKEGSTTKRDSVTDLARRGAAPQARAQHRGDVDNDSAVARSLQDIQGPKPNGVPRGHGEPASMRAIARSPQQLYDPPGHGQSSVGAVSRTEVTSAKRDAPRGASPQARAQHRGDVDGGAIIARSVEALHGSKRNSVPRGHNSPASARTVAARSSAQLYVPPGHGQSSVVTVPRSLSATVNVPRGHGRRAVQYSQMHST